VHQHRGACSENPEGKSSISPVERRDLFSAKSNWAVGGIIILVSTASCILLLCPVLPPFVLLSVVVRFPAEAHPGVSLCL